jgi:hypothetical protein
MKILGLLEQKEEEISNMSGGCQSAWRIYTCK